MIKIQIRKTNVEISDVLRMHVERRLGLALARFADRIGRVIVRFSHADGEGGGSHECCEIQVGLQPVRVLAEDVDRDLFIAVNHATERASRSVARALEREAPITRREPNRSG
jgi:ribosomal subunit interface protein